MSYSSIDLAANDPQLQVRVKAAVYKTLYTDDECRTSVFGQAILTGSGFGPGSQLTAMYWAVAVDTEQEYQYALANGNGSPGFDVSVISDEAITTVVTDTWPRAQPPVMIAPVPPA